MKYVLFLIIICMTMKKCNEIALLDRFLYEGTNTECIIVDIKLEEDKELYDCCTYAFLMSL